jgi:hypothetical protein
MLSALDLLAVIIALVACITLIITTAIQNARLTHARDEWRTAYLELKHSTNPAEPFTRETW